MPAAEEGARLFRCRGIGRWLMQALRKENVMFRKMTVCIIAIMLVLMASRAFAAEAKIGYVDLRKAFYDYEKTKTFETSLNELTAQREGERAKHVEGITKMRDEAQMLTGDAKTKKQAEIDQKIVALQEYDRDTRQQLLTKKNDMFRQVIDDIQKVVEDIGKAGGFDFVLDSRNIMYGKPEFDLSAQVIEKLNKK